MRPCEFQASSGLISLLLLASMCPYLALRSTLDRLLVSMCYYCAHFFFGGTHRRDGHMPSNVRTPRADGTHRQHLARLQKVLDIPTAVCNFAADTCKYRATSYTAKPNPYPLHAAFADERGGRGGSEPRHLRCAKGAQSKSVCGRAHGCARKERIHPFASS